MPVMNEADVLTLKCVMFLLLSLSQNHDIECTQESGCNSKMIYILKLIIIVNRLQYYAVVE